MPLAMSSVDTPQVSLKVALELKLYGYTSVNLKKVYCRSIYTSFESFERDVGSRF